MKKLIEEGAEAKIFQIKDKVIKERIKKSYKRNKKKGLFFEKNQKFLFFVNSRFLPI